MAGSIVLQFIQFIQFYLYNIFLVEDVEELAKFFFFVAQNFVINYIFAGHYEKSMMPHCWYTWLVVSLIPVMFFAGMLVQFLKTGKDHDHREGKKGQTRIDRQSEIYTEFQTDMQVR